MGTPKAEVLWHGQRLVDRAAAVLLDVCSPVIEVGPGFTGLPATLEEPRGQGPLAALVAGVDALRHRREATAPVVVLAVDLPFVGPDLIRLLADWPGEGSVVPVADGHVQVLCARYGAHAIAVASGLLTEGRRSLVALLDRTPAEQITEDRWREVARANAFADLDTPADVSRWSRRVDG